MKPFLVSFMACLVIDGFLPAAESVDYLGQIKPILAKNCYACHGAQKQRGGLRLDTAKSIREGGDSGPVIVPGKSATSKLMLAINGAKDVKVMPPKEPRLSAEQIALLKTWIDQGALAPATEKADDPVAARNTHWAFQPPVRFPLPAVQKMAWVRNPIDRFILARLEKERITPSPEADRVTLIRRLSLDLLGLPPTIQEVEAFLADARPDAYEHLVDRLLQSPHYGERMGRHWLDLARYADSNGFTIDGPRPIWKYRDWVIDAFNRDLPFDQFTIQQLAGDLLPNATLDNKVATGFHRNTLRNEEGGIDVEQFRVESVVDRVNTTGSVFLGLTVGCCQCHDHKFDPIAQREYYQLFAFLNNADEPTLELGTPDQVKLRNQTRARLTELEKRRKIIDKTTEARERKWEEGLTRDLRAELPLEIQTILTFPENGRSPKQKRVLTTAYRKRDMLHSAVAGLATPLPFLPASQMHVVQLRLNLEQELNDLKDREPQIVSTLVMQERPTPRQTNVHIQGDFTRKGIPVSPGVPAVLHPLGRSAGSGAALPNRLDLARWLVDPKNSLTARVTMNRFWQHFFGLGLVETENDFGTQGTPPSDPELLDWLATEFIAQKWSMKAMHRLLVTSATYRQASRSRPDLATVDPRNKLLARQSRLRLEAEIVRDVALASSGLLSDKVGGPSVYPPQPDGVYAFTQVNKNWKADSGADRYRRGMYTYFWRSAPHPGLTVFDAPDANSACTRRNRSNTPLQALTLLNDQAFLEFAQELTARLFQEAKPTDRERIRQAFQLCLARKPRDFEVKRLEDLLNQQRASFAQAPQDARPLAPKDLPREIDGKEFAAWTIVSRVLLNLDEFITRE